MLVVKLLVFTVAAVCCQALTESPHQQRQLPPFDPTLQHVSTKGIHKFQPPGPNDSRGPCPGLNVMANHGYISRTGFATIPELVAGCTIVFGMGEDLATILAAYGGIFDGAGAAWKIGGTYRTGIGGSHGNYEGDSSPLRADLFQYGSNTELIMSQFYELYDMQPNAATADYDMAVIKKFRLKRFQESINKNPWFYYGPTSGMVVSQAAHVFIPRLFSNKSAEQPNGFLNKEVLKSFMSIQGPESKLRWVPGHERIPDNWYRRSPQEPYTLQFNLAKDIDYMNRNHPETANPGCNTGTLGSYTPISVESSSGGAYTQQQAEADPLCFGLAMANAAAAQQDPVGAHVLETYILPIQNRLGCTTVPKLNQTAAQACPGYTVYGGPRAKVAPGAVQS